MSKQPPKISDDEKAEFHAAMQVFDAPAARPATQTNEGLKPLAMMSAATPADVSGHDLLRFSRSGLQHRVFAQLKRGHVAIDAKCDLHGFTIAQAELTLTAFLERAQQVGWRCVLIVHGKGLTQGHAIPPLKNFVNHWLRQVRNVLGFSSAQAKDGGTGAVYVLLKRS